MDTSTELCGLEPSSVSLRIWPYSQSHSQLRIWNCIKWVVDFGYSGWETSESRASLWPWSLRDAVYSFFSLTFCRAGSWLAPVLRWHKWTQPTVAVSRAAQSASWPKTLSVPGAFGWMHVWPMLGSMEGECVCPCLLPAVPGLWLILMSVYSLSVNAALCVCLCAFLLLVQLVCPFVSPY